MRTLILTAAALSLASPATAQSVDPAVKARIDRILKATAAALKNQPAAMDKLPPTP